jgi:hypothetical protein
MVQARMQKIYTFSDVQKILGLKYPQSVAEMVERMGLEVKPVGRNGNAKGLDLEDIRILRRRLRKVARPAGSR